MQRAVLIELEGDSDRVIRQVSLPQQAAHAAKLSHVYLCVKCQPDDLSRELNAAVPDEREPLHRGLLVRTLGMDGICVALLQRRKEQRLALVQQCTGEAGKNKLAHSWLLEPETLDGLGGVGDPLGSI